MSGRTRYAIVGTGARAEMYVRALTLEHSATAELVGFADVNSKRMASYNRLLASLGARPVPAYHATEQFGLMLDKEQVDVVLVTSVDRTHDEYIVAALDAGRDVISEKPMTVDAPRCRRILEAVERTGRSVTVTFNYRYNPVHEAVKRLLSDGVVGEIGSVHFEWLLDVRHGADYFRRWHRDKANSGGLMVHKASHHFDLVNWWLAARPVNVYAAGRLFFYGSSGARHGYDRGYVRAHGAPAAEGDPFALQLANSPRLSELYLEAESEDGYLRDRNVFGPGVSIEDDMAVLARYDTGATMSYHLTAYAPWEGYRFMVNGSKGRLELEMVESDHVDPALAGTAKGAVVHGESAAGERGWMRLSVHPFWEPSREITVPGYTRGGHGGADARMTAVLFGGAPSTGLAPAAAAPAGTGPTADDLDRKATATDGALALLTGLAANESFETGQQVRVADLLDIP
jgi:predicted dehydrogenase